MRRSPADSRQVASAHRLARCQIPVIKREIKRVEEHVQVDNKYVAMDSETESVVHKSCKLPTSSTPTKGLSSVVRPTVLSSKLVIVVLSAWDSLSFSCLYGVKLSWQWLYTALL